MSMPIREMLSEEMSSRIREHKNKTGPLYTAWLGFVSMLLCLSSSGNEAQGAPKEAENSYRWVNITMTAPFTARDGAGALVYRDRMWLIGGWNSRNDAYFPLDCVNDVWSSADGKVWVMERGNTFGTPDFDPVVEWEGRHTAGYVVFRDKMWIIGGDPIQGHYQADVWNSEDGKNWVHVNKGYPVPWGPRVLHYTVVFRDKIWVMGGQTLPQHAPAEERFYDDIWNSSDGIHWKKMTTEGEHWSPRGMIGGNVVFKNRIWVLGGGTYDTPKHPQRLFYNDVWSSADGRKWECHLACAPWMPREYHDVVVYDEKMWVMEGWNQENRNDVWYSGDGVNWHEIPDTPWKPRHAASVFVFQDAIWMIAGNNMEPDIWKLERIQGDTVCKP